MVIQYNDILHEIKSARNSGKKTTKVKIMQVELFKDEPRKTYCNVRNLPLILKTLKQSGYQIKDETTSKQVSASYDVNGVCKNVKVRNLITRNLTISW